MELEPDYIKSIERLLKSSDTSDISFEKSDEYFSMLKNKKVKLSNIAINSLELSEILRTNPDFNEFMLLRILKFHKLMGTKIEIEASDLSVISKYIDTSDVLIHINSKEDYKIFERSIEDNQAIIEIDEELLHTIPELINKFNYKINLTIKDMSRLDIKKLEEMQKKYTIDKIIIEYDLGKEFGENLYELDPRLIEGFDKITLKTDNYDVDKYKVLRRKMDEIVSGINPNENELNKFLTIYKRIGKRIKYDFEENRELTIKNVMKKYDSAVEAYLNPEIINSHNLIGGLIEGKCVCEGYARILKQALSIVGVEAKIIDGFGGDKASKGNGHAWNIIKIDGKWYNTDITWDSVHIQEDTKLDWCLQSDEEFILHFTKSRIKENCEKSYDRTKIQRTYDKIDVEQNKNKEEMSLIENKPNILRKVFEKIRERFRVKQSKISEEREDSNAIIDENYTKRNKKSASWDLSNWNIELQNDMRNNTNIQQSKRKIEENDRREHEL